MGLLALFISILLPLIFWIFNIGYPFKDPNIQSTEFDNLVFWIITGMVIALVGFMLVYKAFSFKNKISKRFIRRYIKEDPSYMVDFYQVIYDFRQYLKDYNIDYGFKTKKMLGRLQKVEFYFHGRPYSILIQPVVENEMGELDSVIL